MASRTQILCLCEGSKGKSIDPVFIYKLMRTLRPDWLRSWGGTNYVRVYPRGGRKDVIIETPKLLRSCLNAGSQTTLMVWADCDDDCSDPAALKAHFWKEAKGTGITRAEFDQIVFIFAKDRIENWIEFLLTGSTDESKEGPRVKSGRDAAQAAKKLAGLCEAGKPVKQMPPSLQWSCRSWQDLRQRMT